MNVIEKDNIQELFSKAFENHTSPVRPDLWTGVQAKMSAAGVTGGSVAVKGISALTKWIVGTAAVTTIGVTTYIVTTNTDKPETKQPTVVTANHPASETPIQNQDETKTITPPAASKPEQTGNTASPVERPNSNEQAVQLFPNDNDATLVEKSLVVVPPSKTVPTSVYGGKTSGSGNSGNTTASQNENKGGGSTTSSAGSNSGTGNTTETSNVQVPEAKIELPNIFTPNGDGANDFCQFLKAEKVKTVGITILDQNNNPIYKTDEVSFKWDGTLPSGDHARIGIYTVLIVYTDMADKVSTIAKPIYLQR